MANITPRSTPFPSTFAERDPYRMMRELMNWDPFASQTAEPRSSGGLMPAFDVKETKDAYVFKADLPGIKEGDLEINCQGNQLTIRGKRDQEKEDQGDTWYTFERNHGTFSRTFTLPGGVDTTHAKADLKDGVLTIGLPKEPHNQPKRIAISAPTARS